MELATSTAIVTGAASGIGRATAQRMARAGAVVVVADIDTEGGDSTVETIRAAGGRALFVRTDVALATDVEATGEKRTENKTANRSGAERPAGTPGLKGP